MNSGNLIDLRSDTVTQPTPGMLGAMFNARVGDDVFGDDPTIIELETKAARLFKKESGLFCPSGTMTNQIALKAHTQPGDEVICDEGSHIYRYEGGGAAVNSGVSLRLIKGDRGRITAGQVEAEINPDDIHFPVSRLVVIENTSNRGGGSCYSSHNLLDISRLCRQRQLRIHLDGARIFNALAATGTTPSEVGPLFDTISVCLSKGLGAPVGSLLLGDAGFIRKARRIRKVFGGGMRQAGYLAAAGIYALDHHVDRLRDDHKRANQLEKLLHHLPYVKEVMPVETNIIVFRLQDHLSADEFLTKLKQHNLLAIGFGPGTIRMVTHLDFNDDMLRQTMEILGNLQVNR
ncbi:MAG: low-specificity L-threonine aldolase [Bacteroidales bacterium]|nr:low-specificity L-threonine aldolase [Bacteroidales bacterium]